METKKEKIALPENAKHLDEAGLRKARLIFKYLKKNRRIQHKDAVKLLKTSWVAGRGFLRKLVDEAILVEVPDDSQNDCLWYFANQEGFYKPAKLMKILPRTEIDRIGKEISVNDRHIGDIARQLYGGRRYKPYAFLQTVLAYFVNQGLVCSKDSYYARTDRGREFGVDAQTLLTLEATALENILASKAETAPPDPAKLTLDKLEKVVEKDLRDKRIPTVDFTPELQGRGSVKFLCLAEILFGNQFTDVRLLNWIKRTSKPDIALVSGLVQGNFASLQKDKRRGLMEKANMDKVGHQLAAAGNALQELEQVAKDKLFYFSGDDDFAIAADYATLAQLAEGKIWRFGIKGSLTAEQERRLWIREYYAKLRIQLETILAYQYRIGRALLNAKEVDSKIGVQKSEYRLIVEILAAKRRGLDYPPFYEKVVGVKALFGNEGKRYVTPDTLLLKVGDKEIQAVHNTNFSPITQYPSPLFALEMGMRGRLNAGYKVPYLTLDSHQEKLYGTFIQGHWAMTLPGMQDPRQETEHGMKVFNRGVLTSKSWRQATVRKEVTTPAGVEIEVFEDERFRLRVLTNKMRRIIEEQKDKPEVKENICFVTDVQHGSITMHPEVEVKYMDYCLYEHGAEHLYENGDIYHGINYKQTYSENRPTRLTSVHSQQVFTELLQGPLVVDAPRLRKLGAWQGNHEWNSFGADLTGTNHLSHLIGYFQGLIAGQKKAGFVETTPQDAFDVSRIRWRNTSNPEPDKINWPYYATEIAGFKIAMSHLWMLRGGGRTPVDKQLAWLKGMANSVDDLSLILGGHYHSVWFAMIGDILAATTASTASQSGYEAALGLKSQVMCTRIEVSNRTGITLEFIPWRFLLYDYKAKSPFLKGKDHLLLRPRRGTLDYKYGKMSPFVEHLIDECTQYTEV